METPELKKIAANRPESQSIGAFLDWLQNEKGIILCEYDESIKTEYDQDRYTVVRTTIEKLLAGYFDIDLDKAETERQGLLDELQKQNV